MELWLVRDLPAWLVGILLIAGLPAVTLGMDQLIHRTLPHQRLWPHNEVTGVIVSVVGVAYAIVIGLCVVSLWEGYTVLLSTTAIVAMGLFFGLDDGVVRRILLVLSSAVIATNLFLIIEMNYPYYGSFAVTPDAYEQVIADLRTDR